MHCIIVHEELLHSSSQVALNLVVLVGVETQGSKVTRKSNIVTVGRKVNVDLVVHCELVNRINTVFYNFLNDTHALSIKDEHESTIEAGEKY